MSINRATFPKQLVPGLNAIFGLSYKDVPKEHAQMFDVESSDRAFEEEALQTGFANAYTKPEGESVTFDNAVEAWTARYIHETIASAWRITEEAVEDNLYDTVAKFKTKALGRSMANAVEVKAANVYNFAFTNAPAYYGGDGVPLLSANHPTVGGADFSNVFSADMSETALENAYTQINLTKDDRGLLIDALPKTLVIPPNLQFVVHRILNSQLRVGTADNDANAIKDMGLFKNVVVNRRLTDSNAWYIRTDIPNGMKKFDRVGLTTKMDEDFFTGDVMYKARQRVSFGWSDPRGLFGSTGSS